MAVLEFTKMHGLGNDFIVIDSRGGSMQGLSELSKRLCHRRLGIGADQVLVLEVSSNAEFRMRIYNADGDEVEMCGNGIRALAKYVWDRGISSSDPLEVETLAGIIRPARAGELITVDMGEPVLDGRQIPVNLDGRIIDYPVDVDGKMLEVTCVSMGNPHAVVFVDNVAEFPLRLYGPRLETHALFPNRTNVEFVQVLSNDELRMRVWERGAGETMACGTGACAAQVAASIKGLTDRRAIVHLDGGDLDIDWGENGRVLMTGPAEEVFEGRIHI